MITDRRYVAGGPQIWERLLHKILYPAVAAWLVDSTNGRGFQVKHS